MKGEGQPRGYVQYQNYCSMCHGEGVGKPGTLALAAKYKGAVPALLDKRTDLTPQLIKTICTQWYLDHAHIPQDGNQRRGSGRDRGVSDAQQAKP